MTTIAWLVALSSLGGYGFFVASLRRFGVGLTSMLVSLTPPVTLAWAALMFGEWPGAPGAASMLVAAAGVGVALLKPRGRASLVDTRRCG